MKAELKNALFSRYFLFAVIITSITFLVGIAEDGASFKTMNALYFFNLCMQLSPLMVFLPFIASLPYGFNFIDEYNSNFFRFSLSRAGYKKYVLNKCFSVFISAFLAVFLGLLICVAFFAIFSQEIDLKNISQLQLFETLKSSRVYGGLLNISEYLYMLVCLVFISLFATLWPIIGMLSSTYIKNRYVSVIMPFIVFFLLWQTGGRLASFFPEASGFLMFINVYYGSVGLTGNVMLAPLITLAFVFLWHLIFAIWFYLRIRKCR